MKANELRKNTKVWCRWLSRNLYYTGKEGCEKGFNTKTKDYTPRHYYTFVDVCDCITRIYDEELEALEIR